jgi:hypothetical protein
MIGAIDSRDTRFVLFERRIPLQGYANFIKTSQDSGTIPLRRVEAQMWQDMPTFGM